MLSWPSNISSTPVEVAERNSPLFFHYKRLRPGSGGAGRFRGGLGQDILIESRLAPPIVLSVHGRAHDVSGRPGLAGGAAGGRGDVRINDRRVDNRKQYVLERGDRVLVSTPGGGGYGPPRARDTTLIARDRALGYTASRPRRRPLAPPPHVRPSVWSGRPLVVQPHVRPRLVVWSLIRPAVVRPSGRWSCFRAGCWSFGRAWSAGAGRSGGPCSTSAAPRAHARPRRRSRAGRRRPGVGVAEHLQGPHVALQLAIEGDGHRATRSRKRASNASRCCRQKTKPMTAEKASTGSTAPRTRRIRWERIFMAETAHG